MDFNLDFSLMRFYWMLVAIKILWPETAKIGFTSTPAQTRTIGLSMWKYGQILNLL